MIAFLRGRLMDCDTRSAVIDVGGVGYLVQVSAQTLAAIGPVGGEAAVLVHTQVKEDAITLFGFHDADERDCFLLLLSVQGVGARIALSLLSVLDPHGVRMAILQNDQKGLGQADGVGPKLATRIATELRTKVATSLPVQSKVVTLSTGSNTLRSAARSALMGLEMKGNEADQLITAILAAPNAPTDSGALIRACLALSGGQVAA